MKKKIINIVVLVALIIATFYVLFTQISIEELVKTVKNSNSIHLIYALLCMITFWILEAFMIDVLIKRLQPKIKFWTALKTTLIGQYFSSITPLASGGQPVQLYILKKDDVSVSNGTAVLVSKFLLFQVTVTIYSLILAILRLRTLLYDFKSISAFVFIGLALNVIGLTIIILMAFNPHPLKGFVHKIVLFLHKIKLIKKPDRLEHKIEEFTEEYHDGISAFRKDIKMTSLLIVVTIIQLTVFFSITYFIYKALGLSGTSYIDIISLQALLYIAVAFIPLPGAAGASEVGFASLLGSVFTGNLVMIAMFLWRSISYYFGLIFCGVFYLIVYIKDRLNLKYS